MQKAEAEKKLSKYPPNWYYDDPEAASPSDSIVFDLNNEENAVKIEKNDKKEKKKDSDSNEEETLVDELNKQLYYCYCCFYY